MSYNQKFYSKLSLTTVSNKRVLPIPLIAFSLRKDLNWYWPPPFLLQINKRCKRQHFPKGILGNSRSKEWYVLGKTEITEMHENLLYTIKLVLVFYLVVVLFCFFCLCQAFQSLYGSSYFESDLGQPTNWPVTVSVPGFLELVTARSAPGTPHIVPSSGVGFPWLLFFSFLFFHIHISSEVT